MKKSGIILLLLVSFAFVSGQTGKSEAALFDFSGTITYHNEIITIPFVLNTDAADVRVWTDSFNNGANFDPITAVWNANTGALLGENDDNPSIATGQTYWDSGLVFPNLSAGNYLFTIAAFDNFAVGTNLSDGFRYDGDTPILITEWWVNAPGNYSVHLSGVDSATNPTVPVPPSVWLLGSGLIGLVGLRRRFSIFSK